MQLLAEQGGIVHRGELGVGLLGDSLGLVA
jgi:hypothetical protein